MKEPVEKTKVVIRHLPPSLTLSDLVQHVDDRFAGRYNWISFRPGKNSPKRQIQSRAYIDFVTAGDVLEFSEFFGGHVFVNEKGTQYKAIVEYAPSQCVPKPSTKKDAREGTIYKDPDYLEFLKVVAKPVENLPSAEIQLERKEAEQAGTTKENIIITPLMEFVRNKRVQIGSQGSSVPGKVRRARAASPRKPGSSATKRGSEKKKYIAKENVRIASRKEKPTFTLLPRRQDQSATSNVTDVSGFEIVSRLEGPVSGIPVTADSGKKKFLLLKGKERDKSPIVEGMIQPLSVTSLTSATPQENQRRESGERLFKSFLTNDDIHHGQHFIAAQSHPKMQILNSDSGKRQPRSNIPRSGFDDNNPHLKTNASGLQGNAKRELGVKLAKRDMHGVGNVKEKNEKRTRNKDRPDRGVWAPRSRSSVSQSSDEHFSPMISEQINSLEGDRKDDMPYGNKREEIQSGGRYGSFMENGSARHFGRRGVALVIKDDSSPNSTEGKASKRGVTSLINHEKQVWVQKLSSAP